MIVQLTGTLVELTASHAVLDVGGVGYELGISSTTAAALPQVGEAGVTILTRFVVREDSMTLYGFSSREERTLFDKLTQISGVGPKLALAVLSTFTAPELARVSIAGDTSQITRVPGVGKKLANRLMLELQNIFAGESELSALAGVSSPAGAGATPAPAPVIEEASAALLSMGFTPQEVELALSEFEQDESATVERALGFALRRLGGGA